MIRLHFIVEGASEEEFVDLMLIPHLAAMNIFADVRMVYTNWQLQAKGGVTTYARARNDIRQWMCSDPNPDSFFTTMFDLYGLPTDFPNYEAAKANSDPYRQVELLEAGIHDDFSSPKLIPYIQLHEFEALLLSDASQFDWEFIEHDKGIRALEALADAYQSPELINDDPNMAPSKRIIKLIPDYEKAKSVAGPLIAQRIGLPKMRERCPHFDAWITSLENLAVD
ncbi:MAG: DUF4276 family protein [Chloroflexota bacterium]